MYKKTLRILCAVMAFILLTTGINLPTMSFAHAEGTAGDSSVSNTPDDLLSMGEWQYWVEDGVAIVAGYTNPNEASLTIPYQLGGYPVAGIGHHAFSINKGLKGIFIHTNVTSIADDAFESVETVEISAYNGAYALNFAASKGMIANNKSTVAEFVAGVIDLSGVSNKAYSSLTDSSVTFNKSEATFLKTGQILYFPKQSGFSTGLAKTVNSISESSEKVYVTFSQPEWGEVFIRVQGEDELYVDWSNAQWGDGFVPDADDPVSGAGAGSITGGTVSKSLSVKLNLGELNVNGKMKIALKKPTVSWDIGTGWLGAIPYPDIKLIDIKLPFEKTEEFSFSLKKTSGDNNKQIYGEKCSLATVPVASIGGVVNGYLTIDIVFELSGEAKLSSTILTTLSFAYKNGKLSVDKTKSENHAFSLSGSAKVGPELKLYFVLGWAGFDIRFFEASIGLFIVADGSIEWTKVSGTIDYMRCSELSVKIKLEVGAKAGLIKVSGLNVSMSKDIKKSWELWDFGKLHGEDGALVESEASLKIKNIVFHVQTGSCSLKNRVLIYDTGYSSSISEGHDVNEFLNAPTTPTRKGYKFEGWYVNAQKSGLPGSDYKVILGKTKIPYCGNSGVLYIEAHWKDINPVKMIDLDKSSITGFSNVGTTEKITITKITPSDANNKEVKWSSSNTSVATVDQKGKVTLKNAGTAVITCTSVGNPSVKATCDVTVKPSPASIALNKNNIFRYSDNMAGEQLTATVLPSSVIDKSVTWESSNTAVASVSSNGFVTLNGLGTATITCRSVTHPNIGAVCTVAVRQAVTGITLNKESELRTNANLSPIKLAATVAPANAWNKALTWTSSNPNVATVSADGTVTPKAIGTTTITCASVSNPNVKDTFELQVIQAVAEIKLNTYSVTRYSDETAPVQLVPEILPANAYNKNVTWTTSNPSVVTVDSNGLVTVVGTQNQKEAHATVTCRSVSNPNVTATCSFTVLQAVTRIELNKTTISTTTDEINPEYLSATVYPAYAFNKAITWASSDPSVATVTSDGTVVFKNNGQAIITCKSVSTPTVTATCTVNVEEAVTGITLSERSIVRYSNQTDGVQVLAWLKAAPVSDREVSWKTNNSGVATVSPSGIITTHGVGIAIITCTSKSNPDVSANCRVEVRQSVTSITLNESEINRTSDDLGAVQLTASIRPASATNKDLIWTSSNPAVATVDDAGLVTLVGPGSAVITCKSISDPEISDTCAVRVRQAVESIRLNLTNVERYSTDSDTVQLTAYIYPSYAAVQDVKWESSNKRVIDVAANGVVTIVGAGNAAVTCTSTSNSIVTAECNFSIAQGVTGITLNKKTLTVYNDQTSPTKLVATVLPDDAANKDLIWSSSKPEIVSVSDNGQLSIVGTGKAVITCRSLINPNASANCTVTVKQAVQSIVLNETELVCYSDDTTEYQLTANVQPAYASNKNVTWKSSNTAVVSVGTDGTLTINGVGTAVITCTSSYKTSIKATCTVTVKQPMMGISLDETAIEMYNDDEDGVQLTATIIPKETDDTDVIWQSDNEYVAIVSDNGLVQPVGKGVAHITCVPARRPEAITATCTVTVKQRVEGLDIEGSTASLLPGETVQLTATCYPEISNDRNVVWKSDNPNIASVNGSGLVTGVNYGTAVIRVTTSDGSELSATYTINVEHELALVTTIDQGTLYAQGNQNVVIANVHVSNASARRMAEAGYELTWAITKPDQNDDVSLDVLPTEAIDRDETYDTTYALVSGTCFDAVGRRTYTVTCSAGPYTASANIVVNVDNTAVPESVTLANSTFTAGINETISIPTTLRSGDSNPVPDGIRIENVSGDEYFTNSGLVNMNDDGCEVRFAESGIYTATIHYAVRNVAYDVNVTFYIRDEQGIVHVRVDELTLDESYLVLVQEETHALHYSIAPLDAYDPSVTWSSEDESVATIDQNGVITAIRPGKTSIACTANDGQGATAICAVAVESFLQLDDSELEFTVYTGGDDHTDLGIVNVTIDSERRLVDAGLNVLWSIEKVSGTACDVAVEEFRAEAEEGITVSGNRMKLLRIRNAGTDTYRLTCKAGEYVDSCEIRINVVESELPNFIALAQTEYTGKVSEIITIDTSYTPATLPEGTEIRIRGGHAFENALAPEYDFTAPEKLIFDAPGTFAANIIFSGDNYTYTCPIKIVISDEDGTVPVNITDLNITPEYVSLLVGDQASLTCAAEPAEAHYSNAEWSSSDTSVATVSSSGKVTAISAGVAFISVTVPESDFAGGCMVTVEDGLTLRSASIDRTVYVDGITRTQLDTAQLTAASSQRLTQAPTWSLNRVSGNNLTLKVKEYNTVDANGDLIYGCAIMLYSMSRQGDTEYELVCATEDETVTMPVIVHAVERNSDLPAGLRFAQTVFNASVNELIRIVPEIECLPTGTKLPEGLRVTLEGDGRFTDAVNTRDYCVSQNLTTLSFRQSGVFEANYVYSYSNMRYVVPVTFRIMDENGKVPVLAASVTLSDKTLWLTEGETARLSAVFTPSDTENKRVTWTSMDPSVATVDSNGLVTAVGQGRAEIVCSPADTYLRGMICTVFVEDTLAVETGDNHISLYLQGNQTNEVFTANLTEGTIRRLNKAGTLPVWDLVRVSGDHSEVVSTVTDDGSAVIITSAALISGGSDEYRLTCTAGDHSKSYDFTVEVVSLGNVAESIAATQTHVQIAVGETATIDFTPMCYPAGSHMPQSDHMWSLYAGIGQDFYDAIDYNVYAENGDSITVRFTKPGCYLLTRQFFLDNLHYEQTCEIMVGNQTSVAYNLLKADTTDAIVYIGGTAGTVSTVTVSDTLMLDVFDGQIEWALSHVSGDSMDAILKKTSNGVELVTVATYHAGEDIWRVTCAFGNYSENIDIHIHVKEPRNAVPQTISLSIDHLDGMMGDWLTLPIAVACEPAGSSLPETGDDFWSFQPIGLAADVCAWEIEDGILRTRFVLPGYYTGILQYQAGNFRYSIPVYISVTDEEGVLDAPSLEMHLINVPDTIYTCGQENIAIGTAEISRGVGSYYAGEAASYMKSHEGSWRIMVTSGNAATLAITQSDYNTAQIILVNADASGTVAYTVTCTVDGIVYSKNGSLTVASSSDDLPDPTLRHSVYYAITGERITIPTTIYDRGSRSILQGTSKWTPDSILQAIGYEYVETDASLQMTFYKEGTYATALSVVVGNLTYDIPFTIVVSSTPITHSNVLKLPAALSMIDDYAFEGVNAEVVDLRGTRLTTIGAGAFSNCTDLAIVYIPRSVTSIASNAFYGCLNVTIVCERNSTADSFARQHNIPVQYE